MKTTQINLGLSACDCINVLYSRQYYLGGTIGQVLKLNIFKNKSLFFARLVHINNTCTLYGVGTRISSKRLSLSVLDR